ncbi:hypothetical protein L7F22_032644 [Adiantum nelumboides]|nr:hypothetical protein [Adiantum nelumboides]
MLDGQGCLLPVRHFHSQDPPVMMSSLSGRYPTCRAEASAETKPNSSTNPHPHHCEESSLVVEVEQESNLDELLDLNSSRSCNASPVSFVDAETTQAWDNNGVFAKESAVSLISADFDCSSSSPSRSALLLPSSPAQEAEATPAQSRSSSGELEEVVTSYSMFAEADFRSADFSGSVQEEGNGKSHLHFAKATPSSEMRKKEDLSRSVGDGSEIRGGMVRAWSCNNVEDGMERSTGIVYPGTPEILSRDSDKKGQFLGSVCASKDCRNSKVVEENNLDMVDAGNILTKQSSLELFARQSGSSPCRGAKDCKKMRLMKYIETSHDFPSKGTPKSANLETPDSADIGQQSADHGQQSADHGQQSADNGQQSLFPGLDDDDCALRCVAFVPLADLGRLSRVGRQFRDIVKSRYILKLRQMHGKVEHLVFTYASGPENWTAYDANRNVWKTLPPANEDQAFRSSDKESLSAGTHVLWFGKVLFDFVYYRYDLLTNSWERGPSMINPRCLFASASCGDFAYVAGGFGPANNVGALTILNSAEKYNSLIGQWEQLPPMSTARQKCAGFFMDGNFYVIGGRDANHEPIMSGEEYNPITGMWRTIPNMYFAPAVHRRGMLNPSPPLVAVANNQLYAVETTTNALKIYNKQSNTWTDLGFLPVAADFRNGWGIAFKALGDRLFVLGDRQGIAAFCWRPGPNAPQPDWQLLSHRERGVNSFLLNCAVMTC